MATMVTRKCNGCGKEFSARLADVNRGWAKSCSKSCAATVKAFANVRGYKKPVFKLVEVDVLRDGPVDYDPLIMYHGW